MRLLLVRSGRVLLAVAGFLGAELLAAFGAVSPVGLLLAVCAPGIVVAGLAAGVPALVVGAVRRRIGAPAGGITGGDVVVHVALLVNTATLAAVLLVPPRDDLLLGLGVTTGVLALAGVPVSVVLSWRRAWTPRGAVDDRLRSWAVGVAHVVHVAAAAILLGGGPLGTALVGSSTI